MKFNEILSNIITEEFANKKLLQVLFKKWYGDQPTDEQKENTELFATEFFKIKDRLSPKMPEVRTFLNRYPNFEINNLRNIIHYDLKQIIFILSEFVDISDNENKNEIPDIFVGKNLPPTVSRISASKDLWYSKTNNLIVDEEGFRVYSIRNRKESQMWGYYHGFLIKEPPFENGGWSQWCTTRYNDDSNLYGNYRSVPRKRTFYFVIDESKNPEIEPNTNISQYYISALQTASDSSTGFKITTIQNNGVDVDITEQKIYEIYPKLRGHFDKIKPIEYSQNELGVITDNLERVDENENNEYAFWKVNTSLKKRYIDIGKPLTKPESWDTMNSGLKQSYFDLTEKENVLERFSKIEFLNHIKKNNSDKRSLLVRLEKIGLSIGEVIDKLMGNQYDVPRISADNKNIRLYEKKSGGKMGLFNAIQGDWVEHNGIKYVPEYNIIDTNIYVDSEGETYVVETFSKTFQVTDDSFYSIYLFSDNNPKYDSHFLSPKKWEELNRELTPENDVEPNDDNQPISDKPKDYSDIKERRF
jgi:hypothetical protein